MLYAVGIGPLTTPEAKTAMSWISEIVDEITVRDQESFQLLHSLGVSKHVLSADPVIQLTSDPVVLPDNLSSLNKAEIKVGLNLRNWSYAENDLKKFQKKIFSNLNKLSSTYPIRYFIFPFNNLPSEVEKANQLANH